MARIIKPSDHSKIGLKERFGYASRTNAVGPTLNIDDGDFLISFWLIRTSVLNNNWDMFFKYWGLLGFMVRFLNNFRITLGLFDGGFTYFISTGETILGDNIVHVFGDRDGLAYFYINNVAAGTANIAAEAGDLTNTGSFEVWSEGRSDNRKGNDILRFNLWNFGVGGIPSVSEQVAIVAQENANPYRPSPILMARPGAASEERLRIDLENEDPDSLTVTDKSALGNDLTISVGQKIHHVCKEFYSV